MSTSERSDPSKAKSHIVRVVIAMTLLVSSSILVVGVWANRSVSGLVNASSRRNRPVAQNQAPSSTPTLGESNQSPPSNVPYQTGGSSAASASETWINFDYFPNGAPVPSGTAITNQYPPAIFSSDPSHNCVALSGQNYGASLPNRLTRGPSLPDNYGYAPLFLNFTQPVNDLRFYILAAD